MYHYRLCLRFLLLFCFLLSRLYSILLTRYLLVLLHYVFIIFLLFSSWQKLPKWKQKLFNKLYVLCFYLLVITEPWVFKLSKYHSKMFRECVFFAKNSLLRPQSTLHFFCFFFSVSLTLWSFFHIYLTRNYVINFW